MSHVPSLDIVNYLSANSTDLTKETNLFHGPVRANSAQIPVQSVFVAGYGGRRPDRFLGTAAELRYPKVSVIVRSSGYSAGLALAHTVYETLQSATPTTGNDYLDVRALQSEPTFLEQDKNMHYTWSLDWEVMFQST